MVQPGLQHAQLQISLGKNGTVIFKSLGDWTADTLPEAVKSLEKYSKTCQNISIQWDVSSIGQMDSAGMMLFIYYYDLIQAQQCSIELTGARPEFEKLHGLLRQFVMESSLSKPTILFRLAAPFSRLGRISAGFWHDIVEFLSFIGEDFIALILSLKHPSSIRYSAIIKNIEDAGVRALPIITMTSLLIGVVIAYQGAVQLQKFGANIFIVDMIGISITRELAPLITAIVVAGRTGSSFTAQLGTMKITEEIDAMRIMGFEPHLFLVLPRVIALIITMPLLVFFADIVGIAGGMLVSHVHLNISYIEFIHRLHNVLEVKHFWIGLCKAPFFAWLIAITGCFRGFQVSRNTESIGRYTTSSVVNAIFLVIACDALFSIVFTELGI